MGAVPHHPFFMRVIDELPLYDRSWLLPYITVMASTGPLFLSVMWRHYTNTNPASKDRVRVLFPEEYRGKSWSFFSHHLGNSWHQGDVRFILWVCALIPQFPTFPTTNLPVLKILNNC